MKFCKLWISVLFISLHGCGAPEPEPEPEPKPEPAAIVAAPQDTLYVGSEACEECHQEQWSAWSDSHHSKAIQSPTSDTVLGKFHGEAVAPGQGERPVADDAGAFSVHREVAGQDPQVFPVRYTFGHSPLQQYLLDVGNGRLQAWSWAWDGRPEKVGGQQWFTLSPGMNPAPGDPLHWTGRGFNWRSRPSSLACSTTSTGARLARRCRPSLMREGCRFKGSCSSS